MSLKIRIQDDTKQALKAGDKPRVGVLRMASAAMKQREIDAQIDMDDTAAVAIINKMIKQRQDSAQQFAAGGRADLAQKEKSEIDILQTYLPEQMDKATIESLVADAIAKTGATGIRDLGKVMAHLKSQVVGQADLGQVSAIVKARLS